MPANTLCGGTTLQNVNVCARPTGSKARGTLGSAAKIAFTSLANVDRHHPNDKPVIGNRVDIGAGACVLGAVEIEDDCVIGANSVVIRDLPRGSVAFGIPARPVNLKANEGALRSERAGAVAR
jgi:serine acetyltransferase